MYKAQELAPHVGGKYPTAGSCVKKEQAPEPPSDTTMYRTQQLGTTFQGDHFHPIGRPASEPHRHKTHMPDALPPLFLLFPTLFVSPVHGMEAHQLSGYTVWHHSCDFWPLSRRDSDAPILHPLSSTAPAKCSYGLVRSWQGKKMSVLPHNCHLFTVIPPNKRNISPLELLF